MAEAILFNVAASIISKLGSPALQRAKKWWDVNDELEKLRTTVETIQAVLLDAEEQYSQSHHVKVWVDSLKQAFYDADDLLDEFSTKALQEQVMTGNKMVKEFNDSGETEHFDVKGFQVFASFGKLPFARSFVCPMIIAA